MTLLTDNGSPFTDRFTSAAESSSGQHLFDPSCLSVGIGHRLCAPGHPQTNDMVERFNGRISHSVEQARFSSAVEPDSRLTHYLMTYNHLIPRRTLKHRSPIQALRQWPAEKPELFVNAVEKLPGLDMRYSARDHYGYDGRARFVLAAKDGRWRAAP